MRKGITISSFKKIPRGFLIALILFLLTEWAVYANRGEIIKDYWNKLMINEAALINTQKDFDYLLMGDSIQKTGINTRLVNDKILTLTLPGGKPMGLFVLLKRYLKVNKPPKIIFLFIDPEDVQDSLFVILRYFITIPEFISICKDLTWRERQIFICRYWASLDLRKVGLTVRDEWPHTTEVLVETMIKNQGYMPAPSADKSISDDHFLEDTKRVQDKISISKRDMKYLDKFVKLAASRNIKIVFLGTIIPGKLDDIFEKTGFSEEYRSFFESLKQRYPNASFVENPILYLKNKYFGDSTHLNKQGTLFYTTYFKNQVFIPHSQDKTR